MEKILKCKNVVLKYGTKEALQGSTWRLSKTRSRL